MQLSDINIPFIWMKQEEEDEEEKVEEGKDEEENNEEEEEEEEEEEIIEEATGVIDYRIVFFKGKPHINDSRTNEG